MKIEKHDFIVGMYTSRQNLDVHLRTMLKSQYFVSSMVRSWNSIWLSVAWIILKECNMRIFCRKEENLWALCKRVKLLSLLLQNWMFFGTNHAIPNLYISNLNVVVEKDIQIKKQIENFTITIRVKYFLKDNVIVEIFGFQELSWKPRISTSTCLIKYLTQIVKLQNFF